jgi:hypothetical protein
MKRTERPGMTQVIGTATGDDIQYLNSIGIDDVIAYKAQRGRRHDHRSMPTAALAPGVLAFPEAD